ncbi:antibiotic biosynthesis monooxygenase family protein [Rhodococcus koreensis]
MGACRFPRGVMVRELAQIDVDAGTADSFEAAVGRAVALFDATAGCTGIRLHRSVEVPNRYWLVVEWGTIDQHIEFRNSPTFGHWRALVGEFFAASPVVEHLDQVALGF